MEKPIRLVSVVGPTASGKTRLAVALAKQLNGEVVSADSMQIYKGMDIATAKPAPEEMQGIPHHLMSFLEPNQTYSVALFVENAKKAIREIHGRHKLPVLAGGTGLYVDSLLNNIQFFDHSSDEKARKFYTALLEERGLDSLLELLKNKDPKAYERLCEQRNPQRVIRALEFLEATGVSITRQDEMSRREKSPYAPVKIGLKCKNREILYERIHSRVDEMVRQGLLEEARRVLSENPDPAVLKAIGYKELIPYFEGNRSLEEALDLLKMHTRRYAKRQMTWFNRDPEIHWFYIDQTEGFEKLFEQVINCIRDKGL